MLHSFRQLLAIMKEDPSVADELPVVKQLVLRAFVWLLAAEGSQVLLVLPVKFFIDELNSDSPSVSHLLMIAGTMAIVYRAGEEIDRRMDIWRNSAFWRMWYLWWGYGHRRELRLSSDWHTYHSTGEKESMVMKNIERLQKLVDQFIFDTLPVTIRITATNIALFIIDWRFGILALVTSIVYMLVLMRNERHLNPLRKSFLKQIKPIERFGSELTSNWRVIKAIGREEGFSDMNDRMMTEFWESENSRHKTYMRCMMRQNNVLIVSRGMLYGTIALLVLWQQPSIGTVVLATTWMEVAYSNYWRFTEFQREMNRGLEALRELVKLMCEPPTVQQPDNPAWPDKPQGRVVMKDMTFAYPYSDQTALKDINLTVEPHTAIALVGFSGSGKSSLMSLLQREYDPAQGSIMVDGIDLRDLDYYRYRQEMVGVVSQQVQLFDGTILDNIRITKPEATETEVVEAAKLANAHGFVEDTDNGYYTKIGEDGIRLSGGQRQRLAIARALLRQPSILIMDEATSSLDAISQKYVQDTIDRLINDRLCTIFVIAHRFSTIMSADYVAVLEDGQITETGTHEQLARRNGIYTRLREMESRGLLD